VLEVVLSGGQSLFERALAVMKRPGGEPRFIPSECSFRFFSLRARSRRILSDRSIPSLMQANRYGVAAEIGAWFLLSCITG